MWFQKEIHLKPKQRGFHLINDEVIRQLPEISKIKCGILQSGSLSSLGHIVPGILVFIAFSAI